MYLLMKVATMIVLITNSETIKAETIKAIETAQKYNNLIECYIQDNMRTDFNSGNIFNFICNHYRREITEATGDLYWENCFIFDSPHTADYTYENFDCTKIYEILEYFHGKISEIPMRVLMQWEKWETVRSFKSLKF